MAAVFGQENGPINIRVVNVTNGWFEYCKSFRVSVSLCHIQLHSAGPGLPPSLVSTWIDESSTDCVSTRHNKALFSSTTQGSLCGPQKRTRALIKRGLRSAEWRMVMEQLDSVNVFIFPIWKFKNYPSLPPGCTLSCLKRNDYLLRVCHRAVGTFDHQLIPKSPKGTIHQNLIVILPMNNYTVKKTDTCAQRISFSIALHSGHLSRWCHIG